MIASAPSSGGGRNIPWRLIGWGGAALLLLLPLVAGAPWTLADFVFAAVMFSLVGLGIEFAVRKRNSAYTMAAAAAIAAAFLQIWFTGAVGIIGNEQDDVNVLFLGVVMVGLLGSVGALFRPAGMALAMTAAAIAQALLPFGAWVLWPEARADILKPEVIVLTGFFTGLWLVSAWLFRKAAA